MDRGRLDLRSARSNGNRGANDDMSEQQRKTGRVGVKLNVEMQCRKLWFLKGPKQGAQAVDISRGGMRLLTKEKLEVGQSLTLLVHRDSVTEPLDFTGTVRWTKSAQKAGQSYYFVGVEFSKLRADQKRLVRDFI